MASPAPPDPSYPPGTPVCSASACSTPPINADAPAAKPTAGARPLATADDLFDALDAATGELVVAVVRGTDELTLTVRFEPAST